MPMQERSDLAHLCVLELEGGHALVDAAIVNYLANQVSAGVMIHQGRPHEIGATRSTSVTTVTEATVLLEDGLAGGSFSLHIGLRSIFTAILCEKTAKPKRQQEVKAARSYHRPLCGKMRA